MADATSTQVDAVIEGTRIRGYANHGSHFDVPLFTLIAAVDQGLLWTGGTPAENVQTLYRDGEARFDKILCLYPWEGYGAPEGTEKVTVKMYDSLDQATDQVDELAAKVLGWLKSGDTVLVHCQAGLNRSNLVAARTLMLAGMSADEAIGLIRERRSDQALCNRSFENWLRSLDALPLEEDIEA